MKKKTVLLFLILALFLAAEGILLGFFASNAGKRLGQTGQTYSEEELAEAAGKINVNGQWYKRKSFLKTYLVMGIDKQEQHEVAGTINNQQSDFNALLVADLAHESYTILFLNRDIMTTIQHLDLMGNPYDEATEQLALAHTYGSGGKDSCLNTVRAVSNLLWDVPVDHYAALFLDSIGILNDAVGGVTVTIADDFSQLDPSMELGKTMRLNAQQAEHFVRSRQNVADQTNLNRMKRQKTYLDAWKTLAFQKVQEDGNFIAELYAQLQGKIVTDLSVGQLSDLCTYMYEFRELPSRELPGVSVRGEEFMEYYVDEDGLQELILELFYNKTA